MLRSSERRNSNRESRAAEYELHWSEWLLISFAFLALGSMILHTLLNSGM
jgi:hypothetical protein